MIESKNNLGLKYLLKLDEYFVNKKIGGSIRSKIKCEIDRSPHRYYCQRMIASWNKNPILYVLSITLNDYKYYAKDCSNVDFFTILYRIIINPVSILSFKKLFIIFLSLVPIIYYNLFILLVYFFLFQLMIFFLPIIPASYTFIRLISPKLIALVTHASWQAVLTSEPLISLPSLVASERASAIR